MVESCSRTNKELAGEGKVVVTGIGMVTPLGLNTETTWNKMIAGELGISLIDLPWTQIKVAGTINDFNPEKMLEDIVSSIRKEIKKYSRPVQLSLVASIEALRQGGLLNGNKLKDGIDPTRVGVKIGTCIGGANIIANLRKQLEQGERLSSYSAFLLEPERVASVVSMRLGLKGPLSTPSAACATGNVALTEAYKDIVMGDADIVIAGGVESVIDATVLAAFDATRALSREGDPKKASLPFDKKRSGFVMSEGGIVLVLEEENHAKKRGAVILARMAGYGNTADAQGDTDPNGEGAERAIREALRKAGGLPKEGLIYVSAHATGTTLGDKVEIQTIKNVFGNLPKDLLATSAIKGAFGHTLAGAGALGAAVCVLSLSRGVLPPTVGLEEPMDEADDMNLVRNEAQLKQPVMAIDNSFGFGGINSVIIFTKM